MTKEEAKDYIREWCPYDRQDKIIQALEQQPCEDCISRQAAINSLGECPMVWTDSDAEITAERDWKDTVKMLKRLPSVTPKFTDAEIQKMQEMEQAQLDKAYELWKAEMQPNEDCISREQAKDAMYALCKTGTLKDNPWRDNPHIDAITDVLDNLPSVQPTRPTGHWIEKEDYNLDTYYECSECGADYCIEGDILIHKYCPNCGARMVEVESEDKE